ncbi:MAG: hypothetical protein IKH56_05435 [Oscillospiraceae bacterium]|nr:hypothetical protein [Oscillospiraceae bacterium]
MKKLILIIIILALAAGVLYLLNTKGYIFTRAQQEQAVAQAYEDGYQDALNDIQAKMEAQEAQEGEDILSLFGEVADDVRDYLKDKIRDYVSGKLSSLTGGSGS